MMRRRRRRRPPAAMMMSSCAMRMSSSAIMMRRRHLERLKHSVLDSLGLYNSVARSCFTCTPRHTVLSSRALCPPNHHCESQSSFAVHCRRTIFHRKHAKQSSIQMPWIRMLFEQLQPVRTAAALCYQKFHLRHQYDTLKSNLKLCTYIL